VIQKWTPSLQTPTGWLEIPVEKLPRTERSVIKTAATFAAAVARTV
jgi:hypothetical protein